MSQTPSSPELSYPAVRNGLDFLRSVVEHLDGPAPGPRAVKFAVVHLQAATEIFLKAGLASIDWKLVFADPDQADETAYKAGDFISIGAGKAITLLKKEGVVIVNREKKQIGRLAKERNKLAHFGGTLSVAAVETLSGVVLEFLLRFIEDHLRIELDADDAEHLEEEMRFVREGVPRINGYVAARMATLEPVLAPLKHYTLCCPDCDQWALIAQGGEVECRICERSWEPEAFLLEYAVGVLGRGWDHDGSYDAASYCPECGAHALIDEVYFAADPDKQYEFCFACSQEFVGLDNCIRCTFPFQPHADDDLVCGSCWAEVIARD
ncbi:hypothetical protein ACFYYS_18490 [Streptomyces sp. NPDC002120]|uniref:hypothetical protein n=1 Tax=Streptomyces sp. NPDC002120 TaxID=3364631 RepID=UPI00369EE11F